LRVRTFTGWDGPRIVLHASATVLEVWQALRRRTLGERAMIASVAESSPSGFAFYRASGILP
jgi:hypothetical protein